MRRALLVLCLVLASGGARANPTSITLDATEVRGELLRLTEMLDEPTGLLATTSVPKLGLLKGDLVRSINGTHALGRDVQYALAASGATVVYLDVVRGGRPMTVRIAIRFGRREASLHRDRLKEHLALVRPFPNSMLVAVTNHAAPSGVLVKTQWPTFVGLAGGDILRKIDGKPVTTVDQVLAAIAAAVAQPEIALEFDRLGQPCTFVLKLEDDPADDPTFVAALAKIKKVSRTRYEIPKSLVEVIFVDPMPVTRGARIVPAMKDGKLDGLTLYAVRPSSLWAALGLTNGDTIQKVNGQELISIDKSLEIYNKLHEAKQIKIELLRRGKPLTLEWTIK